MNYLDLLPRPAFNSVLALAHNRPNNVLVHASKQLT